MTAPKSRPILFSGPMVRAILDGTKTQTRRVARIDDESFSDAYVQYGDGHSGIGAYVGESEYPDDGSVFVQCPFGAPGDLLWVRETWRVHGGQEYEYQQDRASVMYRADMDMGTLDLDWEWRPSIFMPRWASRITLRVESVRVERLRDIAALDCIAEGLDLPIGINESDLLRGKAPAGMDLRLRFATAWDSLHKPGNRWEDNPWVWVVGFRRESP